MIYLKGVVERLGGDADLWRRETIIAKSVARGIADVASSENVDLIAMYTHDRKGIASIVRRSIATAVRRRAPMEVKVFKPSELVGVA